ncbi:hypothetical protein RND81_05G106600 [Saponaria officinalis]|uniref:Uncharacterized protein n=1 Tax=Saponaria officinalis TaxID=3572 RepID=A0AAW1KZT7_SAPOF
MSCTTCKKGLQDNMKCNQCKKKHRLPDAKVSDNDNTTSAILVFLEKEAEKIIGKPINKLLDLYEKEDGKGRIFDKQQCVGKEHTYRVRVEESKYGNERELKVQKPMTTTSEKVKETNKNNSQEPKERVGEKQPTRSTTASSDYGDHAAKERKKKEKGKHPGFNHKANPTTKQTQLQNRPKAQTEPFCHKPRSQKPFLGNPNANSELTLLLRII